MKHKLKERRFQGAEDGIFRDNKKYTATDNAGADYCAVLVGKKNREILQGQFVSREGSRLFFF